MSPTIPILSALLLSLISGSAEDGEQRTDPVSLLRQTLRYWRKVYKSYDEEVTLGYCWADYLLKLGSKLPTNLSPAATYGDHTYTTVEATESQQNPLPRDVTADAVTPFRETQERKHPQEEHATARSTISKFTNDPDEHRIASRSEIIQKRTKRTVNKNKRAAPNNYTERSSEVNENERIAPTIDSYAGKRWPALSIAPELSGDEQAAPRGEFSSRGTSSHAVNPTPNPRDDDKVDSGSTDLGEEDSRRKVLRSLTSHRDSFVEDAFASRSFSLEVAHDGHWFPFRRYSAGKRNSTTVDEMLSDPWMPRKDYRLEGDPAGRRAPFNNDGSSSMTFVRSQFRRVNAERCPCMGVVKLMDSEGNSSCEPTINSKTPRRKLEELSYDSLLSPRGESAIAERSPLESPGSGGEAVKRNALPQFKTVRGGDTKKQHYQQPTEKGNSWVGRDVSAIHPFFLSVFRRSHRRTLYENHGFSPVSIILQKLRQDDDPIRIRRSAPSLSSFERFIKNYEDSANQTAQHSKLTTLQASQNRDQLSLVQSSGVTGMYSFVVAFLKTLGTFAQIGRQIIGAIETNKALACTKTYLWTRIIRWIDA